MQESVAQVSEDLGVRSKSPSGELQLQCSILGLVGLDEMFLISGN